MVINFKNLIVLFLLLFFVSGCETTSPYQGALDQQKTSGERILQRVAMQKADVESRRVGRGTGLRHKYNQAHGKNTL